MISWPHLHARLKIERDGVSFGSRKSLYELLKIVENIQNGSLEEIGPKKCKQLRHTAGEKSGLERLFAQASPRQALLGS
jgi:hypothetical protein